jgi:Domain of unknown function (DUF6430)
MQSLKDLLSGLARHPLDTGAAFFTCFSILFTVVKVIVQFFPRFSIQGPLPLIVGILISLGWAANKVWKPSKTSFKVANCNTTIEVVFDDLFQQTGFRAIPVSAYFDSKLGKPVSDKSLHGIFIKKFFAGYPESFDKQLNEQLRDVAGIETEKVEGKTLCYPIGTTALVRVNDDCYLLFALTNADPQTLKANSNVELMWGALHKLWERARNECGGHPLNLPLVGSGLSGLGLPPRDLLNLVVLSAITETKASEITQTIRIVLLRDKFDDLDLREVKLHWKDK